MSIFGNNSKQLESLQKLGGDVLAKTMDLCVKFDILNTAIEKMDDRMAVLEAILSRVGGSVLSVESKIGVEFKPLIELAKTAVQLELEKQADKSAKNAEEFQKTRKKLSDEDKEMLSTRLLLLLKRDADNLNLPAEMDGGISSDFAKIYNELRVKHGLKPVETPPAQTPWLKIDGKKGDKKVDKKDDKKDKPSKETKKEEKKPTTKKGKKNGTKPGRNRKEKAAGSGNAVSSDKKLADGQG